jgi:hypothetical protein
MNTIKTKGAAAIGLAALALAAAACGSGTPSGDVSSTSTSATAPSGHGTTSTSSTQSTTSPTSSTSAPSSSSPGGTSGAAVPAGFQPGSVTFVSTETGFVLGRDPSCASGDCASLAGTTNGGTSWVGLAAPPVPYATLYIASSTSPTDGVSEVRFANPLDGWMFGPGLWKTTTGGHDWAPVSIGGYVISLETAGGVVDAVVSPCTGKTPCSGHLRLEQSTVATSTFTTVATGPAEFLGNGPQQDISLQSPAGFALLGQGEKGATLYATDDLSNPQAWKPFPDPCSASRLSLSSFVAPDASTLYSLCSGNGAAGSTTKVAVATNGGVSHDSGNAPLSGDGGSLAATTNSVEVIASASGASFLYRSSDGGHTWKTVESYGDGGAGWNDIGFTTAVQGVVIHGRPGETDVVGGINLLMTHDAGTTWRVVPIG